MLRLAGFIAILCLGVALGLGWDRHPTIGWHAKPLPLVHWTFGFDLPDSLLTQRDKARAALIPEQAATQACRTNLDAQGASIRSAAAITAAKLAKATQGVENARAVAESLRQRADELAVYVPKGADRCAVWDDADQHVREALR